MQMQLDPDTERLLREGYADSSIFGKGFFPDTFARPFDKIHYDLLDIIDNREDLAREQGSNPQQVVVACPRGIGKSSILNVLLASKSICYREKHMIMPISHTTDQAVQESENLKYQLQNNEHLSAVFPLSKGDPWNQSKWVICNGDWETCVLPKGSGQSLRGARYRHWRPDLIIVDDLENPAQLLSDDQRREQKKWFDADLKNCVDRSSDDWLVIVLGTILHPNALLAHLLENKHWTSYQLALANEDLTVSNAPHFMPISKVLALKEEYEENDTLDAFWMEQMNEAAPRGEDAIIKPSMILKYDPAVERLGRNPDIENFVIADPARSVREKSNESAVVGAAIDFVANMIYIRYIHTGKMHVNELYDAIFQAAQFLDTSIIAVEVTGLKEHITYPLTNEAIRRGIPMQLIELDARGGRSNDERKKAERFKAILPFFRQGMIKFNKNVSAIVEPHLLAYPKPRKWDVMDCLGYIPQLLAKGDRFMQPLVETKDPYADRESMMSVEMEYADLDYKMPIDWVDEWSDRDTVWDGGW